MLSRDAGRCWCVLVCFISALFGSCVHAATVPRMFFSSTSLAKRGFLARRSTARRRHRYWIRERAMRLAFLSALQVTNAATYQVSSKWQQTKAEGTANRNLIDQTAQLSSTLKRKKRHPTVDQPRLDGLNRSPRRLLCLVIRAVEGEKGIELSHDQKKDKVAKGEGQQRTQCQTATVVTATAFFLLTLAWEILIKT